LNEHRGVRTLSQIAGRRASRKSIEKLAIERRIPYRCQPMSAPTPSPDAARAIEAMRVAGFRLDTTTGSYRLTRVLSSSQARLYSVAGNALPVKRRDKNVRVCSVLSSMHIAKAVHPGSATAYHFSSSLVGWILHENLDYTFNYLYLRKTDPIGTAYNSTPTLM
jgi:hypothetical protein